jgi:Fe(3+) dicitrate transport protein
LTKADGTLRNIIVNYGTKIQDQLVPTSESRQRNFVLLGMGLSYKHNSAAEFYANISENYRSVTFADITIINPNYLIDPNIKDEFGYTGDFGFRGSYKKYFSYDIGGFYLSYKDRIGFILEEDPTDNSVKTKRTNIGDAYLFGIESLFDLNLADIFLKDNRFLWSYFVNFSSIVGEYINSPNDIVTGNKVEFVPNVNFKTGVKFGYKNLLTSLQYTYLSSQYTDATNSIDSDPSGVLGILPAYSILDFSFSYKYKRFKLETGINNVLNKNYFTRRATGYPGPGIIPSAPRNFYATLEIKI